MTRQQLTVVLVVAGLLAASGFGAPHAATAGDSKTVSVTSVQVSKGKLIVKADGKSHSFHGTYENGKGEWVKFDGGEAVGIFGRNNRKAGVQKTVIRGGVVVFVTDSGEIQLGNGVYNSQDDPQPQPQDPIPQPRPNPNSLEIKDGKLTKVGLVSPNH